MTAANLLAYAAQVGVIILLCAGLPRLLRLRAPGVQYAFWRMVLLACILLPIAQPWRTLELNLTPHAVVVRPGMATTAAKAPLLPEPVSHFPWIAAVQLALVAGAAARLAWIAIGIARLHRMRRRCEGAGALGFEDLQAAIGTFAPILWSADVRHPVTFGLLHPVVLLPAALKSVDHAAQRAVVAHELHHVRRRDWAWVLAEESLRSIFWFHPAMWWLISRVQLARETVVDELSILVTNARRTYLDTLLAFADDTGLTSSPAFSARRHLFHRVMLLSKEDGMSSIRIAAASAVLVVALGAGVVGAVNAFPLYGEVQNQAPPRDPRSPAAYHQQAVEYYEKVRKDPALTAGQVLETIMKGIAAEDRALALNPDYTDAMIYKNLLLRMQANLTSDAAERVGLVQQADELRQKAISLRTTRPPLPPPPPPVLVRTTPGPTRSAAMPPPPPPPPPPDLEVPPSAEYREMLAVLQPIRVGKGVAPPTKVRDVKPDYPAEAQAAKIQGVVIVEAVIDANGDVADARVLRSIPMLDDAALAAVRQWRFVPTLLNGEPRAVIMTVTVNFLLR